MVQVKSWMGLSIVFCPWEQEYFCVLLLILWNTSFDNSYSFLGWVLQFYMSYCQFQQYMNMVGCLLFLPILVTFLLLDWKVMFCLTGHWNKRCISKVNLCLFVWLAGWANQQISCSRQTAYWQIHQHSWYLWFWIIWCMFLLRFFCTFSLCVCVLYFAYKLFMFLSSEE